MRTASGAEPVREALEVDLVYLIEDRHHSLLDDLVLQCCDAQRTLPSVSLRYIDSPRRLCPVRSTVNPAVKIDKPILQSGLIPLPSHTIDSRRSLTLESVEAVAQKIDVEMVEQSGELFLSSSFCCFAHTVQSL